MSLTTFEIHYTATSQILQRASFQLRGRKPEFVGLEFWKSIKKEMPFATLEQILSGGEDITILVKELEKKEMYKAMNDNLPF